MLKKLFILTLVFLYSANINSDWVQVSSGVLQPNINAITATGNYIFAGTNVTFQGGGVFRSSNHGINWEQIHFTTTLTLASNSTYVYRGYQNGFSYSSNYGLTWIASGGPSRWILSLLTDSNFVYQGCFTTTPTTNQGVWISSNNGINWTQTMLNNINIYCLTKSGNYLFAGGYTFGVGGGVFLTTNNGQSWTNPLSIAGDALASFGNYIYTGGGSNTGFFLSTNYGQNWAQTSLNNVSVYVLTSYENNVFAGTSSGFWVSNNNGLNWIQRNEGMIAHINTLCVYDGYIFAGTDGLNVWRRPLSEIVNIHSASEELPTSYKLLQNYPNPFNPNTKIKFSIPQRSFIQLKIFDILGREKEKLVNQELIASEYEVDFNGTGYSSGVYFYQLISDGNIIDSKKFIISK